MATPSGPDNVTEKEIAQRLANVLDGTKLHDEDLCASVNMDEVLKLFPEVQVVPIAQMYKVVTPDDTWAYNPADGYFRNAEHDELDKIEFYAKLTGYSYETAFNELANPKYWHENNETIIQARKARKANKEADPGYTYADLDLILPAVSWIWKPWLPNGMVTLMTGESGVGKSALGLAIAAAVMGTRSWPDRISREARSQKVVWIETESAHAITLERLANWNIPKDKLLMPAIENDPLINIWLDTEEGWEVIEKEIKRENVALAVLDSLRGAFRGDENTSDIIELLSKLATLAQRHNISILALHHLRKRGMLDDGKLRLDRVRGSSAIVQIPRVVWGLDRPDMRLQPHRVRLQQLKNNLMRYPESLGFEVTNGGVIYSDAPEEPMELTSREKAANLLLALLRSGPLPAQEVYDEAKGAGISNYAIRKAKGALGIVARREGGHGGHWTWALPIKDDEGVV